MSVAIMTLIWRIDFPTQSQKLIALKLADHSNDEGGNIWPSKPRIARETGCSETTVQLTLKVFRDSGLLEVVEEGGKGPRNSTKYRLNVAMLEALEAGEAVIKGTSEHLELHNFDAEKGSETDGVGNRPLSQTGSKGSVWTKKGVGITDPKPSLKNHQESSKGEFSNLRSEVDLFCNRIVQSETVAEVDRVWQSVKGRAHLYAPSDFHRLKVAANERFRTLSAQRPPTDVAARMIGEGAR